MRDRAEDRIHRQLYRLRAHPDFLAWGPIMDRVKEVKPVPAMVTQTMATNGTALIYNEAFVDEIDEAELRGVLVHEFGHVMNSHHLRFVPDYHDPVTANIAMDHVVNNQLVKLPSYQSGFIRLPTLDGRLTPFCDSKYSDPTKWCFESVYRDIYEAPPPQEQQQPEGEGEQGEGDESESDAGPDQDQDQDQDQSGGQGSEGEDGDENPDPQGNGGGENGEPDEQQDEQSGGGSGAPDGNTESPMPRPNNFPSRMTSLGEVFPQSMTPEERKQERQEVEEALAQGEFIEKSLGHGGGTDTLLATIRETQDEDIGDWEFLRQHLAQHYADTRSWASPNVLYLDHGYLPSRKRSAGTLHVAFDVSGSMSREELEACFANTAYICEELEIHTLKVSYIDHTIRMIHGEVWESFDVAAGESPEFKIMGRGGTDFTPIFDAIEEEQEDVTCLLYFTDGEAFCNAYPPSFPVFWCTTNVPPMGFGEGEFGEVIDIVAVNAQVPWWRR